MPPRASTSLPAQADAEHRVLELIKSRKESGILMKDIKQELKLISENVVKKAVTSLLAKIKIKEVVSIHNKRNKLYMGTEFEPASEISGGDWYENGSINHDLIKVLRQLCLRFIKAQKVATLEKIHGDVLKSRVLNFNITIQKVGEIVSSMVLDNDVLEVKSTGYGDYYSIPCGAICYRAASGGAEAAMGPKVGAFASIPCGACTRISWCTPDGEISPATCVYYNKWLNIEF